jgi:protein required for attachment to host cells
MKLHKIWVLVADGARARILRDAVQGVRLPSEREEEELLFHSEQRQLREIMADKPGRSFASTGARRSAMAYHSDPVRDGERAFAAKLAEALDRRRRDGDFDELVVVAAPQMLGDLRQAFPESLREVVVAEVDKDLTKLPAHELRDAIAKLDFRRMPMSER